MHLWSLSFGEIFVFVFWRNTMYVHTRIKFKDIFKCHKDISLFVFYLSYFPKE